MKKKIYLASTSPRRKMLLAKIVPEFEIIDSGYEEDMTEKLDHKTLVKKLAAGKARAAAEKVHDGVVIAADTFVVLGKKRFGKPKDVQDLKRMLGEQSGKVQSVLTGHAVMDVKKKKLLTKVVETKLRLRHLRKDEIDAYALLPVGYDKAGGWALNEDTGNFVVWVEGDFTSVFGLSLTVTSSLLRRLNAI